MLFPLILLLGEKNFVFYNNLGVFYNNFRSIEVMFKFNDTIRWVKVCMITF